MSGHTGYDAEGTNMWNGWLERLGWADRGATLLASLLALSACGGPDTGGATVQDLMRERELSEAEGELTPTLKIRRKVVSQHFGPQIEELYTARAGV